MDVVLLFVATVSDFTDKQTVSVATDLERPCTNTQLPKTKQSEKAT